MWMTIMRRIEVRGEKDSIMREGIQQTEMRDEDGDVLKEGGEACGQGSASATIRRHDPSVEVEKRNEQLKPAWVIKPAESLRSPYVTRAVDLNDGLSTVEKRLGRWIFKSSSAPREMKVLTREDGALAYKNVNMLQVVF
ncbi:hypothetical protein DM860_016823 [Cuscuta australis]|uniref:Uncharacterized protein n=1 Tax=Cuscuta australis TaxID=267555 RepID=A0A328DWD6_9ASTE|nr:hypothetical protein DM860_016823 [Cuscuta australis]